MPSDNFVEVHDVSLDSDTDAIQTILNREFEPLTNDGNFGIESLRENSLNTEFFSGLYFPVFGLNMEIYSDLLFTQWMLPRCQK